MKIKIGYRWNILGLVTFCILTFGIIFQSIPPLIGILVEALNVSYARAGALMGLFTFASIFLSLPGGMLADRYGARNVGLVALVSMALGTAIVFLVLVQLSRTIGSGGLLPPTLAAWVPNILFGVSGLWMFRRAPT